MFEQTKEITNENSNDLKAPLSELVTSDDASCSFDIGWMIEEINLTIWRELENSFVNQVLNPMFQRTTVLSIMARTIRMISTTCIIELTEKLPCPRL